MSLYVKEDFGRNKETVKIFTDTVAQGTHATVELFRSNGYREKRPRMLEADPVQTLPWHRAVDLEENLLRNCKNMFVHDDKA